MITIMNRVRVLASALALLFIAGCETIYYGVTGADRPAASSTPALAAASDPVKIPTCLGSIGCLRVMSFNTEHRDVPLQLDAVASKLKADMNPLPDFILLQEVVFDRPKKKGQDNTAAALADLLGCQCRGTARDGGMEGVAIISTHPFDHYEYRHLAARDPLLTGGFPRVSVMGEFQLPDCGRIRVVNVHLAYRASQHEVRYEQLKETLQWMADRQREAPADVIIVGGDFNIEPNWNELSLIKDATLNGGVQFMDYNSRTPSSGKDGDPYHRVDYVFVAAPSRTVSSGGEAIIWRDGIPTADGSGRFSPSDHLPLVHSFAISGR